MKKLDKVLVDDLIRIIKKYYRTGDTDLLAYKQKLEDKIADISDNNWSRGIASVIKTLGTYSYEHKCTYQQVYDILKVLGYEVSNNE